MTDIAQRISIAEAVAAALHAYADAIRLGQTSVPNYLTLHTAALPAPTFLALADRIDAPIEIIEPSAEQTFPPYARIELPFGAGILPASINANVHATCSELDDKMRRDIADHNAECVNPCSNGRCIDPAAHAEGAHDL